VHAYKYSACKNFILRITQAITKPILNVVHRVSCRMAQMTKVNLDLINGWLFFFNTIIRAWEGIYCTWCWCGSIWIFQNYYWMIVYNIASYRYLIKCNMSDSKILMILRIIYNKKKISNMVLFLISVTKSSWIVIIKIRFT
jgi:hypothetical protein